MLEAPRRLLARAELLLPLPEKPAKAPPLFVPALGLGLTLWLPMRSPLGPTASAGRFVPGLAGLAAALLLPMRLGLDAALPPGRFAPGFAGLATALLLAAACCLLPS